MMIYFGIACCTIIKHIMENRTVCNSVTNQMSPCCVFWMKKYCINTRFEWPHLDRQSVMIS